MWRDTLRLSLFITQNPMSSEKSANPSHPKETKEDFLEEDLCRSKMGKPRVAKFEADLGVSDSVFKKKKSSRSYSANSLVKAGSRLCDHIGNGIGR